VKKRWGSGFLKGIIVEQKSNCPARVKIITTQDSSSEQRAAAGAKGTGAESDETTPSSHDVWLRGTWSALGAFHASRHSIGHCQLRKSLFGRLGYIWKCIIRPG
jgi:hypothetical protein